MYDALIGYTGFVGSTLLRQRSFTKLYRSTNIAEIANQAFDTVVCAGAPAQKWLANKEPDADHQTLTNLIQNLQTIRCSQFILLSTVDVFKNPVAVDEDSVIDECDLHPYGLHRRMLEKFVQQHFANHLIVRLPGLVGPGLRKNVIFDLLNNNNLANIDGRGVFQFYPMVNLWYDLEIALQAELRLLHLAAEPISVTEIAEQCFAKSCSQNFTHSPGHYDMRSKYAALFNSHQSYQYSKREILLAMRAYVQSELCKTELK